MFTYVSTRGSAPKLGFADVVLTGMANDGGLYVPETLPKLTADDMKEIASGTYVQAAKKIIPLFIGDELDAAMISSIIDKSYKEFSVRDVIDVKKLEDNLFVLELFNGPTLAFKDIALQFLGNMFSELIKGRGLKANILGATSGDTGSAAIEAFKGKENINIFIMHPKDRISDVQRKQMTTVPDDNVFNIAVKGNFDDCQKLLKDLFTDEEFRQKAHLSVVNSINWARILAQCVYYAYISCKFYAESGKTVSFSVPTGNFGNVYSGYVAKLMGCPIDKFIVATNKNDILHRFFTSGEMKIEKSVQTLSPSMDIQVASNFERLLFEIYGRDAEKVNTDMQKLKSDGAFKVADIDMFDTLFTSGTVDDERTSYIISVIHNKYGYMIDPHTAVGLGVAQDYLKDNPDSLVVSLATAHPAKFPDAIKGALGIYPEIPKKLALIFDKKEYLVVKENSVAEIKDFIENILV